MKDLAVAIVLPYSYFTNTGKLLAIPTFGGSTLIACFLLTFFPALTPLWSLLATSPKESDWK